MATDQQPSGTDDRRAGGFLQRLRGRSRQERGRPNPWRVKGMPNRLAGATSPYLLQHAENPVDWWEWGDEAFAEARRRDVPVLLSVGYAACHWCQVSVKSA
jgi:Protein of unknown function, DUF255